VAAIAILCLGAWWVARTLEQWQSSTIVSDPLLQGPPATSTPSPAGGSASAAQTATAVAAAADAAAMATAEAEATLDALVEATAAAISTRAAGATATAMALEGVIVIEPDDWVWEDAFYDDFSDDMGQWPVGDYDSERLSGSRRIADGAYQWEAEAKDSFRWWAESDAGSVTDFALAVFALQTTAPVGASHGVIFRHTGRGDHYIFRIKDTGQYQVAMVQDGQWSYLINWTYSPAIYVGDYNLLSVVAEGSYFTFWINDELVAELDDPTFVSGEVGLLISLNDAGDYAAFEFDDFELYVPPSD
jgi:hypothetical protein